MSLNLLAEAIAQDTIIMNSAKEKIRVVIADDEMLARQLLSKLAEEQPDISIVGLAEDGKSAMRVIDKERPDLVFLDIKMPDLNGIDLAKSFVEKPGRPFIVFVTAFDEYATRAFDLDALDYLVKPIERKRFVRSVARVRAAIGARRVQRLGEKIAAVSARIGESPSADDEDPFVIVKQRDELFRIPQKDIYWLEAASQYVHIHTKSTRYIVAEPLNKYHSRLSQDLFVRVHRSAVVNVSKVEHVCRKHNGVHELRLANGVGVPLSRSRRRLVNDLLAASAASSVD